MNITSLGVIGSAAGTGGAQRAGDVAQTAQQAAGQQRQAQSSAQTADAAGIGSTTEDRETGDRDADGRRLWEETDGTRPPDETQADPAANSPPNQSVDPTGQSGSLLDLTG